ncbi:MAG: 50S ribosomal protein L18 [Candidatus Curtissbacteria bacterium]|nr:50S ribosomal protein L18 [bacterium]MDZ4209844.1 50S ribosomal protein L18 [Candidatus Curtissbacteria bacterium]
MTNKYIINRIKRKVRVRSKLREEKSLPRLSVFRSNTKIYAQIVDDRKGHTLVSVGLSDLEKNKVSKLEQATLVGKALAQKAKKSGIEKVVFDRGSYKYHGRIKALAEGARKGGLVF